MQEMNPSIARTGWIFGKRLDLFFFLGCTLIVILVDCFGGVGVNTMTLIKYLLVIETHVHLFPFLAFFSKSQWRQRPNYLVFIIIVPFFLIYLVMNQFSFQIAQLITVLAELFHFFRQQAAWFFISAAKTGSRTRTGKLIDGLAINTAVLGSIAFYLSSEGEVTWFRENDLDLLRIPSFLHMPILIAIAISSCIYIGYYLWKGLFKDKGFLFLPKHLMWVNALVVWLWGLKYSIFMLGVAHSIPYLYLVGTFLFKKAKASNDFVWPKNFMRYFVYFGFGAAAVTAMIEYQYDYYAEDILLAFPLWSSLSMAHYLVDAFFWKKDKNAEGWSHLQSLSVGSK